MIHAGTGTDAMKFTEATDIANEFDQTGYPGAMIDRVLYDGFDKVPHTRSNNAWADHTALRVNASSPVDVSITHTYNETTRVINATISADFVDYAGWDIRFNLFIVEDNVVGSGSGYDQVNYFNTTSGSPYEGLGNPIVGYKHRHVLRAVPSGVPGTSGVVPAIVNPGGQYSQSYTYTIPTTYDKSEMSLIGFLSYYNATEPGNNDILNVATPVKVGIDENIANKSLEGDFFPNPVSDLGMLSFHLNNTESVLVEVRNMLGQQVKVVREGKLTPGNHKFAVNVSDLSEGIYYVNINEQRLTKKIVVVK